MISKTTPPDSEGGNENEYFDAFRQKNYDASFEGVAQFVARHAPAARGRRRKPLRRWQWALAVLLPMFVILACTKTEHSEPVGSTIAFTVPDNDDAARQGLEKIVGGLQTVVVPDKQRPGYLSYTCFIPEQGGRPANEMVRELQAVKGVSGIRILPVSAQVKESLLAQLGHKVFRTHVNASSMSDEEMRISVTQQLRQQGINDIDVSVVRTEKGLRTLALHPAKDASNYSIDVSVDEKGTRMVLQEERRTVAAGPRNTEPQPDFKSMSDAQVRDYVRQKNGRQLRDEDIRITRSASEINISIKESDKTEQVLRFRL